MSYFYHNADLQFIRPVNCTSPALDSVDSVPQISAATCAGVMCAGRRPGAEWPHRHRLLPRPHWEQCTVGIGTAVPLHTAPRHELTPTVTSCHEAVTPSNLVSTHRAFTTEQNPVSIHKFILCLIQMADIKNPHITDRRVLMKFPHWHCMHP